MTPERKKTIDGTKVEEFYWAGKMVVYIDNQRTDESYDAACKRLEAEAADRDFSEGMMPGGFN